MPDRRRLSQSAAPPELYSVDRWYACRTRSRAEKQVHRRLVGAGRTSYLPLVERDRKWADRVKRVAFPLFPGYVFARFNLYDVHEILQTPGVVTIVRTNRHPSPLRDEEIESVRLLVEGVNRSGVPPSAADYLEPGEEVVITEGPFENMVGVLVEKRARARVVVRLSVILQAVSVELDGWALRPLR